MSVQSPMSVRFWGVRGSIPAPGPDTTRYGGNTPCIEVRCGEHMIILDAGSGIRLLGNALMRGKSTVDADIFFSHCHIDHINGLQTNNGDIDTSGLQLAVQDKGRKDLRATLGGGGARIKLETTNGDITLRGK